MRLPNMLRKIDFFFRPPMPAERLASLRILVGIYSLVYLSAQCVPLLRAASYDPTRFYPVGVASILLEPLSSIWVYSLFALTLISGLAFSFGFLFRWTGPVFALLLLWVTSYRNSWGMIFHMENLMVLHVLILALSPAATCLSLDARHKSTTTRFSAHDPIYGWPVRLMAIAMVLTYLLAGIAKLRNAGWDWVSGDVLRMHIAYDGLRKTAIGSFSSPLVPMLVPQAWLFGPLAWLSMIAELGAPLALFGARIARAWSLLAWSFHVGVLALMAILFPYPVFGIAFLPLHKPERILARVFPRKLTSPSLVTPKI